MSQPVVHFEVIGKDPARLRKYFGELFGWEFDVRVHGDRPRDDLIGDRRLDRRELRKRAHPDRSPTH